MKEVDNMVRKYNFEQLKQAGVCSNYEDIGTYMWHGGAHHVGFDVHDVVDAKERLTAPNMVFCVCRNISRRVGNRLPSGG